MDDEPNVFEGLAGSRVFLYVLGASAGLQVLFMQVLYEPFHVLPLTASEWAFCIAVGAGSLGLSYATKLLSPPKSDALSPPPGPA